MKKKKKYKLSKEFLKKEKKLGKIHSIILLFFFTIKIIYWFLRKNTIGGNIDYYLFTFWIPLITCLTFLSIYRWSYMKAIVLSTKAYLWKAIYIFFFVAFGVLTSVVVSITLADIIWEHDNNIEIKEKYPKSIECDVLDFWHIRNTSRSYISYEFQNKRESFSIDYKYYNNIKNQDTKNYTIELIYREGLNETFVVDSWRLRNIKQLN